MNVANPLPWLFIFILILAVIGAIAAIIWRSWIVGSILLVFVGLIFGRAEDRPQRLLRSTKA